MKNLGRFYQVPFLLSITLSFLLAGLLGCTNDAITVYTRPIISLSAAITAIDTTGQELRTFGGFHVFASTSLDRNTHIDSAMTAGNGRFVLYLAKGTYDLTISREDFGSITIHNLEITGIRDTTIDYALATLYQKPHTRFDSIEFTYDTANASAFVFYTQPQTALGTEYRDAQYVKVYLYDIDPTKGNPNVAIEHLVEVVRLKINRRTTYAWSGLAELLRKNNVHGRVYFQAAMLNGPGYYDPATTTIENNAEGPLSDAISVVVP